MKKISGSVLPLVYINFIYILCYIEEYTYKVKEMPSRIPWNEKAACLQIMAS